MLDNILYLLLFSLLNKTIFYIYLLNNFSNQKNFIFAIIILLVTLVKIILVIIILIKNKFIFNLFNSYFLI